MKVLLCSPFKQQPGLVSGGVNIWGKNILSYYKESNSDVILDAISFDRKTEVKDNTGILKRIINGCKEYFGAIKETKETLSKGKYDVLHLCTSAQLSLVKDFIILRMARKMGVRSVIHFHFGRIPDLFNKNNWEGRLIKRVCSTADSIIVIDQKSTDCLLKNGYTNISYLPNPLSMPIIRQINSLGDRVDRINNKIVFVGHVIPTKGVFELVNACAYIGNKIELHIIGTISDVVSRELKEIAKVKDDGKWLLIRGEMPHEKVITEMLSAGIFVLPSYTEGFPNVILESMACGCSIIATPVGAIPEMLNFRERQFCGLESPVKDVDSVKRNIQSYINDINLMKYCSNNAKERVNTMYAMPVIWEKLTETWTKSLQ